MRRGPSDPAAAFPQARSVNASDTLGSRTRRAIRRSVVLCVLVSFAASVTAARLYGPRIDGRWTGFISYGGEAPRPIVLDIEREGAKIQGEFAAYANAAGALSLGAITGDPGVLHRGPVSFVEGKLTLIRYDDDLGLDPQKPACVLEGRYSVDDLNTRLELSWHGTRVLGVNCPETAQLTAVEDDINARLGSFARQVGAAPINDAPTPSSRPSEDADAVIAGFLATAVLYYVFLGVALVSVARTLDVKRRWRAWFPGLNFVLLLQAARLSNWWALSLFAWPISVVVFAWAWGRIAGRRGLQLWPSWLTWIPLVNIPAISYYAFTVPTTSHEPKFCAGCGAPVEG